MRLLLRRFSSRHLPGSLLLVLLCTAMAGPEFMRSPAAILTVTSTADSGAGSLRGALALTNDGDTIQFATALNGQTIGLTTDELVINKNITIDGPGSNLLTVSRSSGSFRIFHVMPSHTVIIEGLTITGGSANIGGGILNDHATLTVDSCKVQLNSAPGGFGGGIFNYGTGSSGSTLTILNSTINNNHSTAGGGGIANDVSTGGSLTITNCVVTGNSASYADMGGSSGGQGGGIYDRGGTATLRISNTIVSNNRAGPEGAHYPGGSGGGIYHSTGASGAVIITDSTISGNSVGNNGGGITSYGTQTIMTITGSTVSSNSAFGIFESQPIFTSGGGIDNSGTLTIIDSTLSGNSAFSYGGGISGGVLTITNSTLSGNTAGNAGGISGGATISNSTFSGNTANQGNGGAIYGGGAITNSTFSGNNASQNGGGVYATGPIEIGNTILKAGTSGANIFNNGGTVTSHGYNLSSDSGGGFLIATGDQINTDPMLGPLQNNGGPTFTHDLLTGSQARDAGDPAFTPPPLYDQRGPGYDRVSNGRIDIGALEVQPTPTPTPTPTATHFSVIAPAFVIQYFPFNITVTAQDQFNNTATNYTGTVHFTSTDTGVNGTHLPPDSTLTNGTGTFSVMLGTPGNQTITATDTSNASITGTSNTIFVQAKIHPTPTATATATAPATATPPAATPTITPNPTPTPSPSPTPTATATPTPGSLMYSISGTTSYCTNPAPGPVPNVTLTLTGGTSASTLSNGSGNYQFSFLPQFGNYTVTPSKTALPPGSTGINTVDVLAAQKHYLGIGTLLSGCRLAAADVNSDSAVNTVDVIAIQRFFFFQSTGIANVGKYQFNPVSRTYPNLTSNQSGQNYDTLVFGDIVAPFVE